MPYMIELTPEESGSLDDLMKEIREGKPLEPNIVPGTMIAGIGLGHLIT